MPGLWPHTGVTTLDTEVLTLGSQRHRPLNLASTGPAHCSEQRKGGFKRRAQGGRTTGGRAPRACSVAGHASRG